jgi:hypothetical protein
LDNSPQLVYSAANLQQAYLLRDMLIDEGISASIGNEALGGAIGELPMGPATAPQVLVPSEEFQTARQITLQWEAKTRRCAPHEPVIARQPERPWPTCPTCHQRRLTSCPACKTAGDDFRQAYLVAPAPVAGDREPQPPLMVLCPICEDAFEPDFYRKCATCNHDFGDGVVVDDSPIDPVSERSVAWSIGVSVIAVGVGILYWILGR